MGQELGENLGERWAKNEREKEHNWGIARDEKSIGKRQ
jgi:hypothetical protein